MPGAKTTTPCFAQNFESLRDKLLKIEDFRLSNLRRYRAAARALSSPRQAGLGWIGKNTCLINQKLGSWFFLGELLTTLRRSNRTLRRPIAAVPAPAASTPAPRTRSFPPPKVNSNLMPGSASHTSPSSYALRFRSRKGRFIGAHIFGCDICQDVCPWNSRAAETNEPNFHPREFAPELERMAAITENEFRIMFKDSPVSRSKYRGFLRNVAVAMGNARLEKFREPLNRLAASEDALIAEHARWALQVLST